MSPLLTYLAPPVIGAFIGYMTNYIAIRMLFKPLKPWYFLGVRIPMTPGVIPAQRHELARNIGEMVGEHLLTGPDIRKALEEASFRKDLKRLIDQRLDLVMHKDLGQLKTLIPERFHAYFDVSVKILRWRILKHLHAHRNSEDFTRKISSHIAEKLDSFMARDLDEILSKDTREQAYSLMEQTSSRLLSDPVIEQWIRQTLTDKTDAFLAEGRTLHDLIPADISESFIRRLESEAPGLLARMAGLIREPATQEKISAGITRAIQNFTSNLGPLPALFVHFINSETIKQKVTTYLSDNDDTLDQWLNDDAVQQRIAQFLREKAIQFLETPVSDFVQKLPPETVNQAKEWLGDQTVRILQAPEAAQLVTSIFRKTGETQAEQPLQALLEKLFDDNSLQQGKDLINREILAIISSSEFKRLLDGIFTDLIEKKILARRIGPLASFFPREVRKGLEEYILQQVGDLLVREVPVLLDTLNIREVVTRKVDTLNLLRLEELLLVVMQDHFKYINLFGALLGFILGILNLFFIFAA
ncbi:DUF445 family protein [Thermodesulfobacteriota bacterium]